MSVDRDGVIELLNEIKMELNVQSAKKTNTEINMGRLLELTNVMPNRLMTSDLDIETRANLDGFANHIFSEAITTENLKARLVDVNRILEILTRI